MSDGEYRYVYGPGGLPIAHVTRAGTIRYYHHDALGSTRVLSDAAGAWVSSFNYRANGAISSRTGTEDAPLGFAGEYTDAETGFQYLRARYMDPATGQFLTRDPLEQLSGQPYAYAGNSPLSYGDPSGLFWEELASAGMFVSNAAAGALNELTFGLSNQIAGVDGTCAGPGYGFGSGLGFAGGFAFGGGPLKAVAKTEQAAQGVARAEHGSETLGFSLKTRNYVNRANLDWSVHVDLHPTRHGGPHYDIHQRGSTKLRPWPIDEPFRFPG